MTEHTDRPHTIGWDNLNAETQAAIDRQLAKLRPLADCDPAHVRRLAHLLGLTATPGGGADAA